LIDIRLYRFRQEFGTVCEGVGVRFSVFVTRGAGIRGKRVSPCEVFVFRRNIVPLKKEPAEEDPGEVASAPAFGKTDRPVAEWNRNTKTLWIWKR